LTPAEGLALLAAGSTLLAAPGADPDGPLARGLAKLAAVLGVEVADALDVELATVSPALLDALRAAADEGRSVEIDYYAYGRDARTRRVVDPEAVYAADGEWYLSAWCHLAEAPRRFRVDRIRSTRVLDPAEGDGDGAARRRRREVVSRTVFEPSPDDPRVVLELEPQARWVVEQYPVEEVEELGGGRLRVRLVAGERAWLERLLLRLGRHGRAVEGADGVASEAASRVLARYVHR
jgi:proteasome accessory factor C